MDISVGKVSDSVESDSLQFEKVEERANKTTTTTE